jgi:hypothetical protein
MWRVPDHNRDRRRNLVSGVRIPSVKLRPDRALSAQLLTEGNGAHGEISGFTRGHFVNHQRQEHAASRLLVVQGMAPAETPEPAIVAIGGYPRAAQLNRHSCKKCVGNEISATARFSC